MSRVVAVVISNSTRQFDKEYHYLLPDELRDEVMVGMRVLVPFGKSDALREAYIVGMPESSDIKSIKPVRTVLDERPVLDMKLIELGRWMKKRYICTYHDAFKCMLPAGLGIKRGISVSLTGEKTSNQTEREEEVIRGIEKKGGECSIEDLEKITSMKGIASILEGMHNAGVISMKEEYHTRVKEKHVRAAALAKSPEEISELLEGNTLRSIKQIRVLEILLENEWVHTHDLVMFAGASNSVLRALRDKGYIEFFETEVMREPWLESRVEKTCPLEPTDEQKTVLEGLREFVDKREYNEALIHGVTGSGKTEVYMQLISDVIARGRQAIVLVPEISLTPQMVRRFRGRFGDYVAVQHSRLSLGERYDQWRLVKEEKVKVVVGARSAIFAPFADIGVIIVDEEHESSYKSGVTPKYDAREIARTRCRQYGALLVTGSATPALGTVYRSLNGEAGYYKMVNRPNKMKLPQVSVVDMRSELSEGNRSIFSRKLEEEIRANIKRKQQTMLLLNRRGYSSFVLCRSCGYAVRCPYCSITLTYHSEKNRLVCHYCGHTVKNPEICPKCSSRNIRYFGTGTQKVESETRRVFPEASVLRMDMDTTRGKNAHEKILRKYEDENINILVGTQMIAKGHDFPNVTLVGVLAADAMLNVGDYMASERTFQILTQVAGRAGRGSIQGRVVIQTYNTDNYSIITACSHDYEGFYKQEKAVRESLGYPPFRHIGVVVARGKVDRLVYERIRGVYQLLKESCFECDRDAEILKPGRAPISRMRGLYRWRVVIKSKSLACLVGVLTKITDNRTAYGKKAVEVAVDINPVNML